MVKIKVKWGAQLLELDVDLTETAETLKLQLESLTNVPSDRQKVMGVKGGMLKDGTILKEAGITPGKLLMLIGSAEELPPAAASSAAEAEFSEDRKGGHKSAALAAGLRNVGNTCYLNSAIQSVRFIPELQELIERGPTGVERSLAALYRTLGAAHNAVIPMAFWAAFIAQYPAFGERDDHGHPMQHDSQEALGNVLTLVNQTVDRNDDLRARYSHLFQGKLQTNETFPDAPELNSTTSERTFNIFPCNISGEVLTIEAGLERSLTDTVTAANEQVGRAVERKSVSRFSELPEYFVVQFTRFGWRQDTNSKTKILKPVGFPMVLDVGRLCTDELQAKMKDEREALKVRRDRAIDRKKRAKHKSGDAEEVEEEKPDEKPEVLGNTNAFYELSAVISHKGRDADGGHYVAWCKNKGQWIVLDDENTAVVTEEDVQRLKGTGEAHIAYVLVYRSRDPDTHAPPLHF